MKDLFQTLSKISDKKTLDTYTFIITTIPLESVLCCDNVRSTADLDKCYITVICNGYCLTQ